MQLQQWQHLVDLRGLADPGRQDRRAEPLALPGVGVNPSVVDPRRDHLHRSRASQDPAGLVAAVAHHQPPAPLVALGDERIDVSVHLGPQRLSEHPPSTLPDDFVDQQRTVRNGVGALALLEDLRDDREGTALLVIHRFQALLTRCPAPAKVGALDAASAACSSAARLLATRWGALPLVECINTLSDVHLATDLNLDVLLTDDEHNSLKQLGSATNYPVGSILMGEGENTTFALLIQTGHLKIVSGPSRRILAIRGAGEFVGEMAAIRSKPRSASVFALDDVQALYLPGAQWLDFMINNPRVAMALLRLTEERLVETTKKAVESTLGTQQKLANALLELEDKGLGIKNEDGTLLRFGQADLANIAGISIDSAKQGIKVFKTKGLVRVERQAVILKNRDEIEAIARGDSTVSF